MVRRTSGIDAEAIAVGPHTNGLPQTILYVAQASFFSGAERALLLLLQALDPRRFRPVVAVGTIGEFHAQLQDAGIPVCHVPLHHTDRRRVGAWARSVGQLARLAFMQRANLIHTNEALSFQPAGYAARLLGIPAIAHVRFPAGGNAFSWFLKPSFSRAVFVSDSLLSDASSQAPDLFRDRAVAIHDGVRLPRLPSAEEREEGRRILNLPDQSPTVLLAGQVAEVKGIWEYIDAARILIAAGVDATFVVLGDDLKGNGALREAAEQKVHALGLGDRFRFLGFRRNAADLVPLFDIVAVPSHVEPLGNATLEAMAAGRPVVGARVGGIPEMVIEGQTGLLVPPHDAPALAAALRRLLEDGALRERMGRAGLQRAERCFGTAAHAERVQSLYQELV